MKTLLLMGDTYIAISVLSRYMPKRKKIRALKTLCKRHHKVCIFTIKLFFFYLFIQSKNLNKIQLNLFAPCSGKGHIVIWSLLQWCSQFNKI